MIRPVSIQNTQTVSKNISNIIPKQCNEVTNQVKKELPSYSISFCSVQIQLIGRVSTRQKTTYVSG